MTNEQIRKMLDRFPDDEVESVLNYFERINVMPDDMQILIHLRRSLDQWLISFFDSIGGPVDRADFCGR